MKKVLIRHTGYGDDAIVWDTSIPELRDQAFVALFKIIDRTHVYESSKLDVTEQQMVDMARSGNAKAARALLLLRKGETVEEMFIETEIRPVSIPRKAGDKLIPDIDEGAPEIFDPEQRYRSGT